MFSFLGGEISCKTLKNSQKCEELPKKSENNPDHAPAACRPFLVDGAFEEPVPVMEYTASFPFAYIPRLHALALEFPLDVSISSMPSWDKSDVFLEPMLLMAQSLELPLDLQRDRTSAAWRHRVVTA